jgi:hypothetical protein
VAPARRIISRRRHCDPVEPADRPVPSVAAFDAQLPTPSFLTKAANRVISSSLHAFPASFVSAFACDDLAIFEALDLAPCYADASASTMKRIHMVVYTPWYSLLTSLYYVHHWFFPAIAKPHLCRVRGHVSAAMQMLCTCTPAL